RYGTGYYDLRCLLDIKFINGKSNIETSANAVNADTGMYSTCCNERGHLEGLQPRSCFIQGRTCYNECGDTADCNSDQTIATSTCSAWVTLLSMARVRQLTPALQSTIVTQFLTINNTTTGTLSEI
ncbi:glycoside hydrolase family 7 protein, partial [Ramaria rubella]